MDVQGGSVHELWAAPKDDWLDHFVNGAALKKLLNEPNKNPAQKEEIRALVIQFAQQAVNMEGDTDLLIKKQFENDDIAFTQRKSVCLWLCSLACLAAIDWHFEELLERPEDVLLLANLFERIESWAEFVTSPGASFTSIIISRWHLFIHTKYSTPPPPAKQTVSNPFNQLDASLNRFDMALKAIAKIRNQAQAAQQRLEFILAEGKELRVPLPNCFIDPFIQDGGLSLSIGIVGENVLAADTIRPRVTVEDTVVVSKEQIAAKLGFDLVNSFFCAGNYTKSLQHLKKLLSSLPPSSASHHPMFRIDDRQLNGMCAAFRLPSAYPEAAPSTSRTHADATYSKPSDVEASPLRVPQRRYATRRDRFVDEKTRTSGTIRDVTITMGDDVWTSIPVVGWRMKMERSQRDAVEIITRLRALCSASPSALPLGPRTIARGTSRLLAASWDEPAVANAILEPIASSIPPTTVSLTHLKQSAVPQPPPTTASLRAMAASDKPYWTLLTSFEVSELQSAFAMEATSYVRPMMLRFPDILAEYVLTQRPVNELSALLLGKLQQLADIGDADLWQKKIDQYAGPIGMNTNQSFLERSIYEATRVNCLCWNRRLLTPHADMKTSQSHFVLGLVKKLKGTTQFPPLVAPMLAFLLNLSDFNFVMQQLEDATNANVLVKAGRVLAAFGAAMSTASPTSISSRQVVDAWHKMISPYFEGVASKRRHDIYSTVHLRDSSRTRLDLLSFFEGIKTLQLQSFLISYFAHLYTQALSSRGRAHLRIYGEYQKMFTADNSLSLAHMDALDETLTLLLTRAIAVAPYHVPFMRTKADFAYVRNQLNDAAISYVEVLVGVRPSLSLPLPQKCEVIDESVWNHLRICLRRSKQQTLAATICQLFKTGRAKEYRKAAEAIQDRGCMDASNDCFGLIYDQQLGECLSDAYRKRGMQHKLEALLDMLSSATMNTNNGAECLEREMRRKQKRILGTLAALYFGIHF